MELKYKINKILIEQKITKSQLADSIGVNRSAIYKMLRGETKSINPNTAIKIEEKYPSYKYAWLVFDDPNSINTDNDINTCYSNLSFNNNTDVALHLIANEREFMDIQIFENFIEKKVLQRLLDIVKKDKLKEFLE